MVVAAVPILLFLKLLNVQMIRMRYISFQLAAAILLALMLCACTRLGDSPVGPANDGRELVPVPIHLAIAPTEEGMLSSFAGSSSSFAGLTGESPSTKVDYEPDTWGDGGAANAIKTFTILQFEKDNDDPEDHGYTRVGNQVCYAWPLSAGDNIALVTSPRENIIFVIANATDPGEQTIPLSGSVSLADFLNNENASLLSSLDALDGTGIWYSPDGTNRYLRMSATKVVDKVTLGTTLGTSGEPLELKRNCAKMTIKVKNSCDKDAEDRVDIESVQLRDINQNYHFLTNYSGFVDPYSPMTPRRFDNAEQAFPVEKNPDGGASAGTEESYTFYVPANLRGMVENAAQIDKNRHAPQGATYFRVYATSGGQPVTYTYYLGANLTDNFNLEANKKYEFTIDIKGKGNPETDSRFEDRGEIKFDLDANCYMLKPPVQAGATTTYFIPVRRAAVFWNQADTNMGLYGAGEGAAEYTLRETDIWQASLVWNQVTYENGDPVDSDDLLITDSGTGFNPGCPTSQPYIQVRVMPGMRGNAVVAIRKKISDTDPMYGEILWSWHLWVTEYDPYIDMTPIEHNYLYAVPGGEIHRYADKAGTTLWTGGVYSNGFIMDRNLGALVVMGGPNDDLLRNGLYYEWGRKDPFPKNIVEPSKGSNNTGEPAGTGVTAKANIRYSIHHPAVFILGQGQTDSSWTSYDLEGPVLGADATWMDPIIDKHGPDYCEAGKSVYDPCPYGWQVPTVGTWSDFNSSTTILSTSAAKEGQYYYPEGYDPLAPKGRILIPTPGIKLLIGNGGVFNSEKGNGGCRLWMDSMYRRNGNAYGYQYVYSYNGWYWGGYHDCLGNGVSIRCVRLDNRRPY